MFIVSYSGYTIIFFYFSEGSFVIHNIFPVHAGLLQTCSRALSCSTWKGIRSSHGKRFCSLDIYLGKSIIIEIIIDTLILGFLLLIFESLAFSASSKPILLHVCLSTRSFFPLWILLLFTCSLFHSALF